MLFTSFDFLFFFLAFLALYAMLHRWLRWQNTLLLVASYIFYGYWDARFLILIVVSTLVDFAIGQGLFRLGQHERGKRNWMLATSVAVNLGLLGFFKYFNFFVDSFVDVAAVLGLTAHPTTLNIILPVGISFYTFQTMSYTIDIYRGRLQPTRSLLNFAVFVAFFPQLVAGPIERAATLLPQVEAKRRVTPSFVHTGLYLIVWGYFKKVVIADNASLIVDTVFNSYTDYAGIDILIAVFAFSLQIYGDFSGYSDIARGLARLLGFELMVNFRLPYFALNPSDFWNRWHISLSTWLRDYLYIPLGGSRKGSFATYRNLMVTMLLGGLWHGAAWNFVLWGGYHGVILCLYRAFERKPRHENAWRDGSNKAVVVGKLVLMFCLTLGGWFLFRASSLEQISYMLTHFSFQFSPESGDFLYKLGWMTFPLLGVQIAQYVTRDLLIVTKLKVGVQVVLYAAMWVAMLLFSVREPIEFIYFQF